MLGDTKPPNTATLFLLLKLCLRFYLLTVLLSSFYLLQGRMCFIFIFMPSSCPCPLSSSSSSPPIPFEKWFIIAGLQACEQMFQCNACRCSSAEDESLFCLYVKKYTWCCVREEHSLLMKGVWKYWHILYQGIRLLYYKTLVRQYSIHNYNVLFNYYIMV